MDSFDNLLNAFHIHQKNYSFCLLQSSARAPTELSWVEYSLILIVHNMGCTTGNMGCATSNMGCASNNMGCATDTMGWATNNMSCVTDNMGCATSNMGYATGNSSFHSETQAYQYQQWISLTMQYHLPPPPPPPPPHTGSWNVLR